MKIKASRHRMEIICMHNHQSMLSQILKNSCSSLEIAWQFEESTCQAIFDWLQIEPKRRKRCVNNKFLALWCPAAWLFSTTEAQDKINHARCVESKFLAQVSGEQDVSEKVLAFSGLDTKGLWRKSATNSTGALLS